MRNLGTQLPEDLNMWQLFKMIDKGEAVCECHICGYKFTKDSYWFPGLLNGKFICGKCDKRNPDEC